VLGELSTPTTAQNPIHVNDAAPINVDDLPPT